MDFFPCTPSFILIQSFRFLDSSLIIIIDSLSVDFQRTAPWESRPCSLIPFESPFFIDSFLVELLRTFQSLLFVHWLFGELFLQIVGLLSFLVELLRSFTVVSVSLFNSLFIDTVSVDFLRTLLFGEWFHNALLLSGRIRNELETPTPPLLTILTSVYKLSKLFSREKKKKFIWINQSFGPGNSEKDSSNIGL